jgi:hypothetical protein
LGAGEVPDDGVFGFGGSLHLFDERGDFRGLVGGAVAQQMIADDSFFDRIMVGEARVLGVLILTKQVR